MGVRSQGGCLVGVNTWTAAWRRLDPVWPNESRAPGKERHLHGGTRAWEFLTGAGGAPPSLSNPSFLKPRERCGWGQSRSWMPECEVVGEKRGRGVMSEKLW